MQVAELNLQEDYTLHGAINQEVYVWQGFEDHLVSRQNRHEPKDAVLKARWLKADSRP
tara:strand:- start:178 stop:351 length:174 start_codon:yes stop_codon:yes gene_type:complete